MLDSDWTAMEGLAQVGLALYRAINYYNKAYILSLLYYFILQRSTNVTRALITVNISVPTYKAPMSVHVTLATCCWPMAAVVRVSACSLFVLYVS